MLISPFSLIHATKSDQFTMYLSQKIYNDCSDIETIINNNSVAGAVLMKDLRIKDIRPRPQTLTIDPTWHNVHSIIYMLSKYEPYIVYINYPEEPSLSPVLQATERMHMTDTGEEVVFSNSGLGIWTCGNKVLDINGDEYFWGGELIEVPKVENTYTLTLLGLSLIQNGGVTIIGWTFFGISILGGFSLISIGSLFIPRVRKVVKKYLIIHLLM